MAFSTARRVSGVTRLLPFTTRETVARDTPAARATASSVFVSFLFGSLDRGEVPFCESALMTRRQSMLACGPCQWVFDASAGKRSQGILVSPRGATLPVGP